MTIDVPADLEASIRRQVERGRYPDATAVIRAAIRLLEERQERAESLRASVAAGLAATERGEGSELTPELWEEIDREAVEKIRRGLPHKPDVCS